MPEIDTLLKANEEYAQGFDKGGLASPPARRVAIITCMDARLHPEQFLGLEVGDAHVIRNAGGVVTDDAIRSLAISERLLGTQEVVVIHHTDCGMLTFKNEDIAAKIKNDLGVDVGDMEFHPFTDLEQSVRDDVQKLRDSNLIPDDIAVCGAVYDVHTGRVHRVTD